jgi:hypothetical protein
MQEALIVVLVVAALAATPHLRALLHAPQLMLLGTALLGVGTLASALTGVGYHLALWRTLGRRGALSARWWWTPVQQHVRLLPAERGRVLPWFWAGAASFGAVVVGAALLLGTLGLGVPA